ncbi:MAG: HEAT repeat domain-containing protein [Acidobacteriota bacterium]
MNARKTASSTVLICMWLSFGTPFTAGQSSVEKRVENILLLIEGYPGGREAMVDALRNVGPESQVRTVLLRWLSLRPSRPDTMDGNRLHNAIAAAGALKAKWAIEPVSKALLDPSVHETTRSTAARMLGEIDPEAAKETLIRALDPQFAEYVFIRIHSAEALAKTKDPEVLKILRQYAAAEKDEFVLQRLQETIGKMSQAMKPDSP